MEVSEVGPDKCVFCRYGNELEAICGSLHRSPRLSAHHKCMQYSATLSQYLGFPHFGGFKIHKVEREAEVGKKLKCLHCKQHKRAGGASGATSGCGVNRCHKTFHFTCAAMNKPYVTRRLVVKNAKDGSKQIHYRVFCGPDHEQKYCNDLRKAKHEVEIQEESDDEGDQNVVTDIALLETPPPTTPTTCEAPTQEAVSVETTGASNDKENGVKASKKKLCGPKSAKNRKNITKSAKENSEPSGNGDGASSFQSSTKTNETSESDATPKFKSSVAASCTSEEDNEILPHNPAAATGLHDDECVLALVENLDDLARQDIDPAEVTSALAREHFSVPAGSVYNWQLAETGHMETAHMLLFMVDVARSLSKNELQEMWGILFDIDDQRLEQYKSTVRNFHQYLAEVQKETLIEGQMKKIRESLEKAKDHYGAKVGCIQYSDRLKTNVMCLHITDLLDTDGMVRAKLGHHSRMFQWDKKTRLRGRLEFDEADRTAARNKEYICIRDWITSRVGEDYRAHILPRENILHATVESSVTRMLREIFRNNNKDEKLSIVAFVGPVDGELLASKLYIQRAIRRLVSEKLSDSNKLYVITDVDTMIGYNSQADFISNEMPGDINIEVWSGLDPAHAAVSCVVLYFEKQPAVPETTA